MIHGLIGAMSTMYTQHVDPNVAFKALPTDDDDDLFAWDNTIWARAGVVTPTGADSGSVTTRNSFPARRAAIRILQEVMHLDSDVSD